MMSSTPHRDNRGFTLTEMLVVIGMIVLLIGIATPMITRAWRLGDRTRTAADLQAISAALDAYKQDMRDYPEVAPGDYGGARALCRAIVAPIDTDGMKGPGFRKSLAPGADNKIGTADDTYGGQTFGPYIAADKFKMGDPSQDPNVTGPGAIDKWALLDRYGKPILYYRALGKPNIRLTHGYVWKRSATDRPLYNVADNDNGAPVPIMPQAALSPMLGDTNANGMIDGTEQPATELPFLLWSTGPDEIFGPDQSTMNSSSLTGAAKTLKAVQKSDDVTNFPR